MEKLTFFDRLKHAFNAFRSRDPTNYIPTDNGASYTYRPDRPRMSRGNERSIVNSITNRIAMDVASVELQHCRLDEQGRYLEPMKTGLNECLTVEANIDQSARNFLMDIVISMFDEGVVAVVPIETSLNPKVTQSYDIFSMRTGKILEWKPTMVKVKLYNDRTGNKEEMWLPKKTVAIIENPLFPIINEPNSTMQRLIRKLNLLDIVDEQSSAGKLDLIIQLPYVIKSQARKDQAESRRKDIEMQLAGSKYGIAYTDGTERITQLNRPIENNLLKQVEYLTNMLYSQLGFHQTILDGTADEKTMLNYRNRTVKPIIRAIVDEFKRKFLTKTARTQRQSIEFYTDMFEFATLEQITAAADVLCRNEIASSNEMRQKMGWKPSDDPRADELHNSNMPYPEETGGPPMAPESPEASAVRGDTSISELMGG